MALQVGQLFALISANDGPFRSTLNSAQKAMESAGKKISGIGKGLTASVTAPITGLAIFGLKYNSTMQDLQTSFKVMLGSQEKAVAMTDKLKKMGAATPFETSQLAEYTKTMLAFGYTEKNVIPIMSRLGDVSLGNNATMSSLTRTMGQINALGKLQGGDLNQLIGQGWNPLNAITKKSGETMEQVRKRMQAGKISYKEVEQALVAATSKGGQFYKGMEEGSKTLSGQISTLKDTVSELLGELTKPIFDKLMKEMPKIIKSVSDLGAKFSKLSPEMKTTILVVAGVAAAIGPLLIVIGSLITAVGTVAGAISGLFSPVGLIILGVVVAIGVLVASFMYLWKTNKGFRDFMIATWERIKNSLISIWNNIKIVATAVWEGLKDFWAEWGDEITAIVIVAWEGIAGIIEGIVKMIDGILKVFAGIAKGDWSKVCEGIKNISDGFNGIIQGIFKSMLAGLIVIFTEIGKAIMDAVSSGFNAVVDFFTGLPEKIGSALDDLITAILDWGANMADTALQAMSDFGAAIADGFGKVIEFFASLPGKLIVYVVDLWTVQIPYWIGFGLGLAVGLVYTYITKMINFWVTLPGRILGILNMVTQFLVTCWTNAYNTAITEVPKIINSVVNFFQTLPGKLQSFFLDIVAKVIAWAQSVYNTIITEVPKIINSITNFFQQLPGKIVAFFSQIVKDIISWGTSSKEKATTGAQSISNAIVNTISGLPGKMLQLGKDVINSFIDGVKGLAGKAASAVSNITSSASRGVTTAINTPGFALGTSFAPGGLALVGELGPELVNLPRGSKVYNNNETSKMLGGGGGQWDINLSGTIRVDTGRGMENLNSKAIEKIVAQCIVNNASRYKR